MGGEQNPTPTVDPKVKKRNAEFRERINLSKQNRRKLIPNWSVSIDYRRGKPFASQSDDDQVAVNLDWALTKSKQASLFSQVPQVRVSHPPDSAIAGPWLGPFTSKLNDNLVLAGVEATMDECLPDCINAAGFAALIVAYESITQDKQVPSMDMSTLPPQVGALALQTGQLDGKPIPMVTVPQTVDSRYTMTRISPSDFLWPADFTGSNFDVAPWVGRSGRVTWAEAVQRFKLKDEDREGIMGDGRTALDKLSNDVERDASESDHKVEFDEIYYKEFQYNPDATSYTTIHHLVFLSGKPDAVIDEPWNGQKLDDGGTCVIGASKYPIRVLTLAYISDECIPPSDSAIGRPQVNEINEARTNQIKQRKRNLPVRWFDVNRVDPTIQQSLMKGKWQEMIPVQGEGSRIIGEVAKGSMPPEDMAFFSMAKNELNEEWTIGSNQMGSGEGVETKGEASEIASNVQTRIGRERAKVASFLAGAAEVLGGLMCLYEDPTAFGQGFDPHFSKSLNFSVLADSTVLLDSNQRISRLNQFMDTYAKSGYVQIEPVLREIAILAGLDPNTVIKAPGPKPPDEPNISLRLSGTEDLMNPLTLAFLLKSGQAPSSDLIDQAKQLIQQAVVTPPDGTQMSSGVQPVGGMPLLPSGPGAPPPGGPPPPGGVPPPGSVPPPPGPGAPPVVPPSPQPPAVGEAHPNMTILPKINNRSESGGKQ